MWPNRELNCINEFSMEGYFSRAFPTLFPTGTAEFLAPQIHKITISNYLKHLVLYDECEVCLEQFPNLRVDTHQSCKRCASDKYVPKLFSSENNMNPGAVPPVLTVSCYTVIASD